MTASMEIGTRRHQRQAEMEGGAAVGIAAEPQPPLVQLDEGAADRQADAHARGLARRERHEQLARRRRRRGRSRCRAPAPRRRRRAARGAARACGSSGGSVRSASSALRIRLTTTCCSITSSPRTGTGASGSSSESRAPLRCRSQSSSAALERSSAARSTRAWRGWREWVNSRMRAITRAANITCSIARSSAVDFVAARSAAAPRRDSARAQAAQQVGGGADRLVELVRQRGRHLADRDHARGEQQLLAVVELALHRAALLAPVGQAQQQVAVVQRGELRIPFVRVAEPQVPRLGRRRVRRRSASPRPGSACARALGQRACRRRAPAAARARRRWPSARCARGRRSARWRRRRRRARRRRDLRCRARWRRPGAQHDASSSRQLRARRPAAGADDDVHAPLRAERGPEAAHGVDAQAHLAPAQRAREHRPELHLARHRARALSGATSWRPRRGWCSFTTRTWHQCAPTAARSPIAAAPRRAGRRARAAADAPPRGVEAGRGHSTKAQAGPAGSAPCGQASTTQRPRCHCSAATSSACAGMRAASAARSARVSASHQSPSPASSRPALARRAGRRGRFFGGFGVGSRIVLRRRPASGASSATAARRAARAASVLRGVAGQRPAPGRLDLQARSASPARAATRAGRSRRRHLATAGSAGRRRATAPARGRRTAAAAPASAAAPTRGRHRRRRRAAPARRRGGRGRRGAFGAAGRCQRRGRGRIERVQRADRAGRRRVERLRDAAQRPGRVGTIASSTVAQAASACRRRGGFDRADVHAGAPSGGGPAGAGTSGRRRRG